MRQCITMIVFFMLVCCDNAAGGGSKSTTPIEKVSSEDKKPVHDEFKMVQWTYTKDPVEVNLDDLSFTDAFRIEHLAKGEGHTFWWNGSEYTTDLYIDVEFSLDGNYNWVRNSDDMNDHCRSNIMDECGICDGKGPFTWYIDLDGDGLGDPSTYTKDCNYPSVDEE